MRIALHATGDVGRRAGLVLLAERDLAALGLYGHHGAATSDRRTIKISTLEGFDLLVTDDPEPTPLANIAFEDGLCCVTSSDVAPEIAQRFDGSGLTLLQGANLRGLSTTLAAHESARVEMVTSSVAAWTVPGSPLRRGIGVGFPEPVGARWGRDALGGVEVPVSGAWAGASATVSGIVEGNPVELVVGVADHREHLEALALAAGALALSTGAYATGVASPADRALDFLGGALRAGLGVAAYTV